jgi:hypothetical protein
VVRDGAEGDICWADTKRPERAVEKAVKPPYLSKSSGCRSPHSSGQFLFHHLRFHSDWSRTFPLAVHAATIMIKCHCKVA